MNRLWSLLFLLSSLNLSSAAYQEKACASRGGTCQQKNDCKGSTLKALCPTQPASVLCCISGGSGSNNCGCSYDYATKISEGPAPGATKLASYFKGKYGGRTEIYNPRSVRGSKNLSLHAEGRAVDLYVTGQTGRNAFDHAVSIACSSGIQEVIFNRRIWTKSGEKAYSGVNPHTDHVHIGLNRCGGENFSR